MSSVRRPLATFFKQTTSSAVSVKAAKATATASFGWFGLGLRLNSTGATQSVEQQVQELIESNKVFVFSKTYCSFCGRTKTLLDTLNVPYSTLEIDEEKNASDIQKELFRLTQQSTVPNIFINGRHVGGNSDLQALYQKGELLDLIADKNGSAEPKAKL